MLRIIAFSVFMLISHFASGQFGVTARYNSNSFTDYYAGDINVFDSNIEVGANYWFRLKNYRVEFLPEVYYGLTSSTTINHLDTLSSDFSRSYIGLQVSTHIYLFDLENDCNCPTFSKQGPSIGKGLYFALSPGVLLYNNTEENSGVKESGIVPQITAGLGYDIGINNLLTISPYVNYRLGLGEESIGDGASVRSSDGSTIQGGIRLIFRPDYVKQYGR